MAKFSVGGEEEDGEGTSNHPRPKRPRIITTATASPRRSPSLVATTTATRAAAVAAIESEEEEEEEEDNDYGESEEEEEEEEEDDDDDDDNDNDACEECEREQEEIPRRGGAVTDNQLQLGPPQRRSSSLLLSSSSSGLDHHSVRPNTRNGSISVTLTDPDVLDCPICYEPLTIPVFQCENGHTACSSCCRKLGHKCPSCSMPIGYNRCRAIEKVLESVKVSCQYMKYGCKEMVSYSKKCDHDKTCNHAPCLCPQSGCNFIGSSKQLYLHFSSKHTGSAIRFGYNIPIPVFFTVNDKFLVLQEEREGVLFILSNTVKPLGNVLTLCCIGPSSKGGYFYELTARTEGSNLRLQSFTKNIQSRDQNPPSGGGFLLVPLDFFGSYGQINLDLCIWRYGACPLNIESCFGSV